MTDAELDRLEAKWSRTDYALAKTREEVLALIDRVRELQAATSAYRLPPEPGYTETKLQPGATKIEEPSDG